MTEKEHTNNKKSNFFSDWLEQLQQESWQLELLISGLALFGIWESRTMIRRLGYYFEINASHQVDNFTDLIISFLWVGWAIFLINLLIHIIIRGLWIGAIGLRYVSGEVNFEKLNYSDIFIKHYRNTFGSFDSYIERLEKYSSIIFSYTFLLFFMFLSGWFAFISFALFATILDAILGADKNNGGVIGIIGLIYFGVGLLVLIDFITLGAFKKVKDKTFSRIYFWIYQFYSIITLSFIFRPLLLNFIDNKFTRRLFFMSFPYIIIVFLGLRYIIFENTVYIPTFNQRHSFYSNLQEYAVTWNSYDDLRTEHHLTFNNGNELPPKKDIHYVSMDEYEQSDNTIELFIRYYGRDREHVEKYSGHPPFREEGIRHALFWNKNKTDPKFENLTKEYIERRKLLNQIVKDQNLDIQDSLANKYANDIRIWKNKNPEDLATLRAELQSDLEAQKKNFIENKYYKIIEAILSMYTFKIDGNEVEPEGKSYFYVHPNMHEKGIICYLGIDSLDVGGHELQIKKQRFRKSCDDELCPAAFVNIPFRKL